VHDKNLTFAWAGKTDLMLSMNNGFAINSRLWKICGIKSDGCQRQIHVASFVLNVVYHLRYDGVHAG